MKKMRFSYWIGLGIVGLFLLMQLIPSGLNNPPTTKEMYAPVAVQKILKRACYDCHSNQTKSYWYSNIAPVKFMIAHNVEEGRSKYNFSTWDQPQGEDIEEAPQEIWESVSEGKMPESNYLWMHPEAKLSQQDLAILKDWAMQSGGGEENEGGNANVNANVNPNTNNNTDAYKNTNSNANANLNTNNEKEKKENTNTNVNTLDVNKDEKHEKIEENERKGDGN